MLATAAGQANDQAIEAVALGPDLVLVGPGATGFPIGGEDVGVGQRLGDAFPPAAAAGIQPKLVRDGPVAHQKGRGRGDQHSLFRGGVPTAQILSSHNALLDHIDVGPAQLLHCRVAGMAGANQVDAQGHSFGHPAKMAG